MCLTVAFPPRWINMKQRKCLLSILHRWTANRMDFHPCFHLCCHNCQLNKVRAQFVCPPRHEKIQRAFWQWISSTSHIPRPSNKFHLHQHGPDLILQLSRVYALGWENHTETFSIKFQFVQWKARKWREIVGEHLRPFCCCEMWDVASASIFGMMKKWNRFCLATGPVLLEWLLSGTVATLSTCLLTK